MAKIAQKGPKRALLGDPPQNPEKGDFGRKWPKMGSNPPTCHPLLHQNGLKSVFDRGGGGFGPPPGGVFLTPPSPLRFEPFGLKGMVLGDYLFLLIGLTSSS